MNIQYIDGKEYPNGIKTPDLGSIVSVGPDSSSKKEYRGLWSDRDKLQQYLNYVPTASRCYFTDKGVWAEFFAHDKTWYCKAQNGFVGTVSDITQISDEDVDDYTDDTDIDFQNEW